MKIINLAQRTDEWLAWRRSGVTATDAVILLGKSPYKTIWRLWAEKVGFAREADLSGNPLVRDGVRYEDDVRRTYEDKFNDIILPVCIQSDENPLWIASLDGLNVNNEPVELKYPSDTTMKDVVENGEQSKAYELYFYQVQHQILVSGADKGWLVFYRKDYTPQFFEIERNPTIMDGLEIAIDDFWDNVQKRNEPEKSLERDLYLPDGLDAERWIDEAQSFRAYDGEVKELKARIEELESSKSKHIDSMKELMGSYLHADYAGVMVTHYAVKGRVDYKSMVKDGIFSDQDTQKYLGETSARCRVTVTKSLTPRDIVEDVVVKPLEGIDIDECNIGYF